MMLDKLKQLGQLKSFQDEMKSQRFEVEKSGVKVVVNGSLIIEEISFEEQGVSGPVVKDCVNEAIKKAQQAMAQKMMGMGFGR
jgi:DNA-binding protein YbaB